MWLCLFSNKCILFLLHILLCLRIQSCFWQLLLQYLALHLIWLWVSMLIVIYPLHLYSNLFLIQSLMWMLLHFLVPNVHVWIRDVVRCESDRFCVYFCIDAMLNFTISNPRNNRVSLRINNDLIFSNWYTFMSKL